MEDKIEEAARGWRLGAAYGQQRILFNMEM